MKFELQPHGRTTNAVVQYQERLHENPMKKGLKHSCLRDWLTPKLAIPAQVVYHTKRVATKRQLNCLEYEPGYLKYQKDWRGLYREKRGGKIT